MASMFYHCDGLTSLDLSSFNTSKVNYYYDSNWREGMFEGCTNLTNISYGDKEWCYYN